MKIVTSTCVFPKEMDALDVLPRLQRLGFEGIDMDFCYEYEHPTSRFNLIGLDWAKQVRETAEKLGLTVRYSHAPYDASTRGELVEKTLQCCQIMGVQYTVVHPIFWREDHTIIESVDEFIETNAKGIRATLELYEKYNVKALSENLLWGASIKAENIDALVKEVNSPYFGWCYDTGHANAFKEDHHALIGLENVPEMFHIQDNNADMRDDHMIPFDGKIDWYEFMKIVKEIGYKNDFTLEAHHQSLELPDDQRDPFLSELVARSRKLVNFYQSL